MCPGSVAFLYLFGHPFKISGMDPGRVPQTSNYINPKGTYIGVLRAESNKASLLSEHSSLDNLLQYFRRGLGHAKGLFPAGVGVGLSRPGMGLG